MLMMSELENRNATATLQALEAVQEELSAMHVRLGIMENRLHTLAQRNEQMEAMLLKMQAASVSRGSSVRE